MFAIFDIPPFFSHPCQAFFQLLIRIAAIESKRRIICSIAKKIGIGELQQIFAPRYRKASRPVPFDHVRAAAAIPVIDEGRQQATVIVSDNKPFMGRNDSWGVEMTCGIPTGSTKSTTTMKTTRRKISNNLVGRGRSENRLKHAIEIRLVADQSNIYIAIRTRRDTAFFSADRMIAPGSLRMGSKTAGKLVAIMAPRDIFVSRLPGRPGGRKPG